MPRRPTPKARSRSGPPPLAISANPDTLRVLAERTTENRSATLHALVARYEELVRRHLPALTPDELALCVDATRGTLFEPWSVAHLSEQIREALRQPRDDLTGGADLLASGRVVADDLVVKLPADYAGQLALLDRIERWRVAQHAE